MTRKDIHNSDVPELCRACEARHRGVCGALSADELLELSRHTKRVEVAAGTVVISEEEPIESYANVLSGVIKLSKVMEDGRQQIVGLKFAPDLLGRPFREVSGVTAEAATSSKLCMFSKAALERSVKNSHDMTNQLHQQALRELDDAREWMLTLGRKTAYEKVASFLRLIAVASDPEREDGHNEATFQLPLTRSEMADFLGLTIETVSRQMTALRKSGVIEMETTQTVRVPDLARLHLASGF